MNRKPGAIRDLTLRDNREFSNFDPLAYKTLRNKLNAIRIKNGAGKISDRLHRIQWHTANGLKYITF